MSHDTILQDLADYSTGRLEPASRRRIDEHLASCTECASWLATYRLLASSLEPGPHPRSRQLALYAIAPGELLQEDRQRIRTHLDVCRPCRSELQLTQAATHEARRPRRLRPRWRRWKVGAAIPSVPRRLAIAAGVVLLLITGTALLYHRSPATNGAAPTARTLHGNQLLEGDGVVIAATEIAPGADVTIRADQLVIFGEGFSMAAGAKLTVETVEVETFLPEL